MSAHRATELQDKMRRQRERWMNERAIAMERKEVEKEMRPPSLLAAAAPPVAVGADVSGAASRLRDEVYDPPSSMQGSMANPARDADILNRLAERISTRLKEELKVEMGRESKNIADGGGGAGHHGGAVQTFLSSELQSHCCPICFELMKPPKNNPVLLFPCGHTFCDECITTHEKTNNNKCPYCRARFTSKAVNHSLKQLIESFLSKKTPSVPNEVSSSSRRFSQCGSAVISGSTHGAGGGGAGGGESERGQSYYEDHSRALQMRCRILEQERESNEQHAADLTRRLSSWETVARQLRDEETKAQKRVQQAQEQLRLVQTHATEQASKRDELLRMQTDSSARRKMIDDTLTGLRKDADKASVMIHSLINTAGR